MIMRWPTDTTAILLARDEVSARTPGVEVGSHSGRRCHLEPGRRMGRPAKPRPVLDQGLRGTGREARHQCREVHCPNHAGSVTGVATEGGELIAADAVVLAPVPRCRPWLLILESPSRMPRHSHFWSRADPCTIRSRRSSTPHVSPCVPLLTVRWRSTPGGRTPTSPAPLTAGTGCPSHHRVAARRGLPGPARQAEAQGRLDRIGPKPIPGDGEPVLGRVDDVNGLYVAFTHSGATLGLIAGELLAYEIITGAAHPMLIGFNLRRFL